MSFTTRRVSDERPKRRFPWKRIVLAVAALFRFQRKVEEDEELRRIADERRRRRVLVLKRIMLVLCGILAAGLVLTAVLKTLVDLRLLSVKGIVFSVGAKLPQDEGGRTNILLLGVGDKN